MVKENDDHYCLLAKKTDLPAYEMKWIMSIFHDNSIQAHQNMDVIYYHISKKYL